MGASKTSKFPAYDNPPVIEVACGFTFKTLENFKAPHLGLFWEKIKKDFPKCQHATRLGPGPPKSLDLSEYVPRVWFINKEDNMLIQVQDNIFYFNWRRIKKDEDYPHYDIIIEKFKQYLKTFQDFLDEQNLGTISPQKCELTYINHILQGEGWESLQDINLIFRDFSWDTEKRFLSNPISIGGQVNFDLKDEQDNSRGILKVNIQHGELRALDQHPVLILQIKAESKEADKNFDEVWNWYDLAHRWIVYGFTDITERKIQEKVWKRTV